MSKTGQFSTMLDDQFRHVISQLPLSGRTATTTRATRGSSSSTPQPAPMLMLAPPSYVPQYPQGQQQPQTQMQMQQTQTQNQTRYQHYQIPQPQTQQAPIAPAAPVVGTPISSSAQAYFTSYSSRLRTGATLLVQPTLFPGSTTTGAATAANSTSFPLASTLSSSTLGTTTRPTRASRRSRGTVINYAEVDDKGDDDDGEGEGDDAKKDGDHIPDAGALDDDATDGDFVAGNGNGRRAGRPSKQQQQQQLRGDSSDLDQSYLGLVPPARFIKSRGFLSNAATAQGGPMFALDYGPNYTLIPPTHPNPILIPVRLEFDVPELGLHIRDVFLWNLHEPSASITPEVFAAQFCRDLDIGVDPYEEMVARQIRAQVEDARGEAWVGWMDSLPMLVEDDEGDTEYIEDQDSSLIQNTNPECRVILSLDVQISTHHLTDHIEWDLLSPLTPEAFSLQLCTDLGLSGEAIPLIVHAVHEELCRHRRDVVDWGVLGAHPPLNLIPGNGGSGGDSEGTVKDRTGLGLGSLGRPARERDGRYPKPLRSAWRDWAEAEEYATRWEVLSPEEVERREVERERAGRRLRRETSKWRSRR
ncbi:hypothetical protein F5051DRAFT_423146 [Lentinula edodes]|nr:hypothetical protein F5051DRAFT_423146 [Lentinula edodes]